MTLRYVADSFISVTKNVSSTMCGAPVRDETLKPLLVGVIGGAIALVIFVLRLCAGLPAGGRPMGWDDYAICVAVALGTPPTIFSVLRKLDRVIFFFAYLTTLTQHPSIQERSWKGHVDSSLVEY
jgi:hypothetical protein